MGTQNLAQGVVHQVRRTVVAGGLRPFFLVHDGLVGMSGFDRQFAEPVDGHIVFLYRVDDRVAFPVFQVFDVAPVAHLAPGLGIERGGGHHYLVQVFAFLVHLAVAQDPGLAFQLVVAGEHHFVAFMHLCPVVRADGGIVAGACLLLLHFLFKAGNIHFQAFFPQHQFGQVEREAVSIVEYKGIGSVQGVLAFGFELAYQLLQEAFAGFEGFQECVFLFADYFLDKSLLLVQFGEVAAHLLFEDVHQFIDEGIVEVQEAVAVAYGTAQDAADHVAGLVVGRQLPVGNGEADRPHVVGNDPHGHIALGIGTIGDAGGLGKSRNQRLEHIGIVIRFLSLDYHAEPLEAHPGIDALGRQFFQMPVGHALELHEHQVPDFDYQRIVLVDQILAVCLCAFLVGTQVDMDFGTRAAGAGVAHLPEIVVLVAEQDAFLGDMLHPVAVGFHVLVGTVFLVPAEHGHVQAALVYLHDLRQELPSPSDGFFLEIVAEGPVAEHLEHGVVVGVVPYFLQVVVLARYPEAFLGVGHAGVFAFGVPEENVLELVHPRVGEHQGRVVLDDHRGRRHDMVLLGGEEIQEGLPYSL